MKVKLTFDVVGRLRLPGTMSIALEAMECTVVTRPTGVVEKLAIETTLLDQSDWPRLDPIQDPVAKWHLDTRLSFAEPIFAFVRRLEGLLSFFGVSAIPIETARCQWIPETESEARALAVRDFRVWTRDWKDEELDIVPPSLIARSLVAARSTHEYELPLVFHRRALVDFQEGRFIEAFYDFFFMLESAFGRGKFRKRGLCSAFMGSPALTSAVQTSLASPGPLTATPAALRKRFEREFLGRDVEWYVEHVVDLRGVLHHHDSSRPGVWHPERQQAFELEATVLAQVCHDVAFDWAGNRLFSGATETELSMLKSTADRTRQGSDGNGTG